MNLFFKRIFPLSIMAIIIVGFVQWSPDKTVESPRLIGPYLQKMSDDEVTVCWAVQEGSIKITEKDTIVRTVNQYAYHKSVITGLKPGQTYTYDVFQDGTERGKGTFTTFPDSIRPFHFAVLGDTRNRHAVHQRIVNRIIEEKPLFVVNTGDLVARGNRMADWEQFFRINDRLVRNVPYYAVLGNHEQDSENYFSFFTLPGNERYYFFSVGDALFVILDMEGPDYNTPEYLHGVAREKFWMNISGEYFVNEKKWLENVLALNDNAGYIFVFFHPAFYSIKSGRVAEAKLRREFWGDIFERHRVTAVLNGHDHYYHHAFHGGVHYIVSAGGGAPLYDTDAIQPETVKYKKIEHFMRIDVGTDTAVMKAIDINGGLIEQIVVMKRSGEVN